MDIQTFDNLLLQNEVLEITRLSRMTVYRYARAGQFPQGQRQAGKLVWRASAIEDYVNQITTTGRWVKR